MANKQYPSWVRDYGPPDWKNNSNVYYARVIKTGSYNAAHATINDGGFVDITAAGYSIQNLVSRDSVVSGSNVNCTAADVSYGSPANNGEIAIAVVIARRLGASPASSDPVAAFLDVGNSPNLLPFTLDGGPFDLKFVGGVVLQTAVS